MATPAAPLNTPTPGETIRGACPCCQSAIVVEGGVVRGGDPSAFFKDLQAKAQSADEWRNKCVELEGRRPPEPAPAPVPEPEPAEETEFFL